MLTPIFAIGVAFGYWGKSYRLFASILILLSAAFALIFGAWSFILLVGLVQSISFAATIIFVIIFFALGSLGFKVGRAIDS